MRRIGVVLVTACFLLASVGTAFAHSELPASDSQPATAGEMPKHVKVVKHDGDKLTAEDRKQQKDEIHADDFNLLPHVHTVDWSGNRYTGYVWGAVVKEATNCSYTNTQTSGYSYSRSYGNRFSLSGAYEIGKIKTTVGYDFTWTTSESWTDSMTLQPRTAGKLQIRDWYDHTDVRYHTDYYNEYGMFITTEYGSGWTEKWLSKEMVLLDKPLYCSN